MKSQSLSSRQKKQVYPVDYSINDIVGKNLKLFLLTLALSSSPSTQACLLRIYADVLIDSMNLDEDNVSRNKQCS